MRRFAARVHRVFSICWAAFGEPPRLLVAQFAEQAAGLQPGGNDEAGQAEPGQTEGEPDVEGASPQRP